MTDLHIQGLLALLSLLMVLTGFLQVRRLRAENSALRERHDIEAASRKQELADLENRRRSDAEEARRLLRTQQEAARVKLEEWFRDQIEAKEIRIDNLLHKVGELQVQVETFSQYKNLYEELKQKLTAMEDRINKLQNKKSEQESLLNEKDVTIQQQVEELREKDEQLKILEDRVAELLQQLTEKDATIKSLRSQLDEPPA